MFIWVIIIIQLFKRINERKTYSIEKKFNWYEKNDSKHNILNG